MARVLALTHLEVDFDAPIVEMVEASGARELPFGKSPLPMTALKKASGPCTEGSAAFLESSHFRRRLSEGSSCRLDSQTLHTSFNGPSLKKVHEGQVTPPLGFSDLTFPHALHSRLDFSFSNVQVVHDQVDRGGSEAAIPEDGSDTIKLLVLV